jgi:polyhydroxybutyrate depolymerase
MSFPGATSEGLRRAVVVVLVVGALVLGACSSSSASRAASTGTTSTTASVPPTTADPVAARPAAARTALTPGDYVFTFTDAGTTRDYRLHVPAAASTGQALPLVLNLHGATQNGQLQELYSQMDANADVHGYLVAYPDGTRIAKDLTPDPVAGDKQYGFDAGACCGLPSSQHLDDVDELLRVLDDASSRTLVDASRVYVTGMSNGGMMAYTMAAEASDRIAAVASVSGQVELSSIHPGRAVPTLEFHSVDDPVAQWAGAKDAGGHEQFSVMDGIDQWVRADGCSTTPHTGATLKAPAGTVGAQGALPVAETATLVTWSGCRDGAQVELERFTGSGHVWPGNAANTGPKSTWALDGVGAGTTLVDADEVMWQFFSHYRLPAATSGPGSTSSTTN